MIKGRVIPVILWDGMNCVQTVRFARPARVFGSLMDAVRVYERRNVDELILLNINSEFSTDVMQYTRELFCPVTLGGGIKTLKHIEQALRSGADKVAIRTAGTPEFIEAASRRFGAQAIVRAIDVMPQTDIKEELIKVTDAELAGAGEILLTSVKHNGTMQGCHQFHIMLASGIVNIPVIAHGGCGKPKHMLEAIKAGAHAVAASTMFLFTETTPRDCSRYLAEHGIAARVA